jgi:hypothetical protein
VFVFVSIKFKKLEERRATMKKGHAYKLSVIIVVAILAIFYVLSVHAQDLKVILLKPAVWVGEWSNPNTGYSGQTEMVFESRGEKVVAKLYITAPGSDTTGTLACERDVIISADTINFDGCRDQNVALIFDPNDKVYQFKSKTKTVKGFEWKCREK